MWGVRPRILASPLEGELLDSFVGGERRSSFNATYPLVRLDVHTDGLRLRPSAKLLRGLVPIWEARLLELSEVQAIGNIPLFTTGIRFRIESTSDWIIFWTTQRSVVLWRLESLGLKVSAEPLPFNHFKPGR